MVNKYVGGNGTYKDGWERNRWTFRDVGHIRTLSSKICRTFKDVGHIRTLFSKNCRTFKDVGHIRTSDI